MRIAHITDLHLRQHIAGTASIAERQSRRMAELFPKALAAIAARRPDVVVVSGDLVDVPDGWLTGSLTPEQSAAALADYRLVRGALDDTQLPYVVVPGNHDRDDLLWQVFDRSRVDVEIAGHRVVSFHDHEGAGHVPERVGDDRARFERVTGDTGVASPSTHRVADVPTHRGLPQVHVQHYVVWPEENREYPHTYGDGRSLATAVGAGGVVRLCLSGHYHRGVAPARYDVAPNVTFATAPAFCVSPFPWWVYDLADDAEVRWTASQL
jgi:3',5'-cyclic AMP phosphodiesterase CpdA